MMRIEKDYEELFELLNKHDVKYCVIGAFAYALYARPRYTKDIDILIDPTDTNAVNILNALNEFGFGSLGLKMEDFSTSNQIIQLGYEPVRVDILTGIEGIDFQEIWRTRNPQKYGNQTVWFISLENLITTKKLSNRSQDQTDLHELEKILKNKHT